MRILNAGISTRHLLLLCISHSISTTQAILQTAAIEVTYMDGTSFTMLASQALFGAYPAMSPENNPPLRPQRPPPDDPLLCNEANGISDYRSPLRPKFPSVALVPRGECSFERKALSAQRLGHSGIIISGSLASRYHVNATTGETIFPKDREDYDCDKASSPIPMSAIRLPYNPQIDDPVLTGPVSSGNLCAVGSDRFEDTNNFEEVCPSRRCLLTGDVMTVSTGRRALQQAGPIGEETMMKACCAWDLPIWLFKDPAVEADASLEEVDIPALYLTMEQSDVFAQVPPTQLNSMSVTMYRRYSPKYNISAFLVWIMGVVVAGLSSYISASEYRSARKELEARNDAESRSILDGNGESQSCQAKIRNRFFPPKDDANIVDALASDNDNGPRGINGYERVGAINLQNEDTLELTMAHAIAFSFVSAAGLLTLFYLKIYSAVKVMYVLSACNAMVAIIFIPLFSRICRNFHLRDRIAFSTSFLDMGTVTYVGLIASLTSYGLGVLWLYMSFTIHHPDNITFFWIMQDIMGAAVCITFLSVVKLNSIKVATILLIAAFFYDIFFVFVTPYLTKGGKSIMIDVATGGGPPKGDPLMCEKYPDEEDCQGGDLLPMLLTIPRLFDYGGGSSLLGLGDIVLPGLLLSFAARYDEAKRYIGVHRGGGGSSGSRGSNLEICSESKGGYFVPIVFAYAIGLSMANIAVYMMEMGQPALLYLVPCCLGTMCFLGWRRGEIKEIWKTPKVLTTCDQLLRGDNVPEESGIDHGAEIIDLQ